MLVDLTRRPRLAGDCEIARIVVFDKVFVGRGEDGPSSGVMLSCGGSGSITTGWATMREALC